MTVFNDFSDAYDLMFPWEARMEAEKAFYEELFREGGGQKVLDCACGTGMHSILFARMGLDSYGSDLSLKMVETAMERAMEAGVTVNLRVSSFTELTSRFLPDERFDAVICVGNSLTLAPTDEDVALAIRQMHEVLKPGGRSVLNIFNWDKLAQEELRIMPASRGVKDGRELTFLRIFHHLGDVVRLHIVVMTRIGDKVETQVLKAAQRPVGFRLLEGFLRSAGFVRWEAFGGYDRRPFDPETSDNLLLVAEKG